MQPTGPILKFENVAIGKSLRIGGKDVPLNAHRPDQASPRVGPLPGIDFELFAGQLLFCRAADADETVLLSDTAVGLRAPEEGSIVFLNQNWRTISADDLFTLRGKIGFVFKQPLWIEELSVEENITMAQRHHSRRRAREILSDAEDLGRTFGLSGLPRDRPSQVEKDVLRKAALVRAFLGEPKLLILENPAVAPETDFEVLVNAMEQARQRGAAVLFSTTDAKVWREERLRPTFRAESRNQRWNLIREEGEKITGG